MDGEERRKIILVEPDPQWPVVFAREAARVRQALGERALRVEHVGSTSIPGLIAKPVVDLLLEVADSADEPAYVPALEAAGYTLHLREPHWFEHRLFRGPDARINLHVFSRDCSEVRRMLLFRDWLRENCDDRELYERTKRLLAQQQWERVQDYADAKTPVIEAILARAAEAVLMD